MRVVEVRAGGVGDVDGVVRLAAEVEGAPRWGREAYWAVVEGDGVWRRLVVAEAAGELVGFAVGSVVAGGGELEGVAVREGWRRAGVGRRLCLGVMGWCAEEGARWMELEVRVGSEGARRMYEGLGFVEVGRRRGYYRDPVEDAVLLRRELGRGEVRVDGG